MKCKSIIILLCIVLLGSITLPAQQRMSVKKLPGGGVKLVPGVEKKAAQYHGSANAISTCTVDTITLTSQADIDNFSSTYPSCVNPKYLFIDGIAASPAITNLNGISSLTEVQNKLTITNTSLTTLAPLNNLTLIGDTLELRYNPLLTTFGMYNLDTVGALIMSGLPLLDNIDGFSDNITTINRIIMDTTALTDLTGLSGIAQVNNNLDIRHTPIINLSDLTSLTSVSYLWLQDDSLITGLGLTNLTYMDGLIMWNTPAFNNIGPLTYQLIDKDLVSIFFYKTGLSDLSGMDSARSFINTFIGSNDNLTSLHGLEQLTSINYGVTLFYNPVLTDITAFSGVTSIDFDKLEISGNDALASLNGLGSITNIGGGLWIQFNPLLTTLNDLNSGLIIQSNSGDPFSDSLFIYGNSQLAVCSSDPICNFLAVNGGSAVIFYNATGCSSIPEIEANCTNTCNGLPAQTWNGNNSSDWDDPDNWTPYGVPGTCTKVTIPAYYEVPESPYAYGDIHIGGLVMEPEAELDMDFYNLTITGTLHLEDAYIYNGNNMTASRIFEPFVHGNILEANFYLMNYTGASEFWYNGVYGNAILRDSAARNDNSSTFSNYFDEDLIFINNSDYGNNYLSNASSGGDEIIGNLTVVNNSSADISVGLGPDNPILVRGNLTTFSNSGGIDFNNFTFGEIVISGFSANDVHITQGGTVPIVINNLYLWKSNGGNLILDQDIEINNSLTFDRYGGGIISDTNKLLILRNGCTVSTGSNGPFVIGPVKKIGNQAFTFPIGDSANSTTKYAPLSMSAPVSPTDAFTARYYQRNPNLDGLDTSLYSPGFGGISSREYWTIARNNGSSNVDVKLSYDSSRSGVAYLYDSLRVAGWNGSLWQNRGTGGYTGNIVSGTVISNGPLSTYGPVTLAFKPVRKPIITMGDVDSIPCRGTYLSVPFSLDTAMVSGNTFRVELSDSLGNFSPVSNTTIGSKISITSDTILCFISNTLNIGSHYRVRVVGSLPGDTSINTKTIIPGRTPQLAFNITGPNPACLGVGVQKYYPTIQELNTVYSWTLSGGGSFTTSGDTAIVTWTTPGFYNLTCKSSNHCGFGPQKIINVEVKAPAPTATGSINNTGRWLYSSQAPALAGYQWYRNGTMISGATNVSYYASLAGDYIVKFANYCGSGPASNTISFGANAVPQTITFPALSNKTYGDAPFVPAATASSGLPVSLTIVTGPATINSQTNVLTITGTGLVTVKASQSGDNVYDTAATVIRSFTVNKATQVITFPVIADQDIRTNTTVSLIASSSSGLPISYSIVSGLATVSGSTVTLNGLGTVVVRASQVGDTNYLPATNVDRSFCTSVSALNPISGFTNICPGTANYTVNNIAGATYIWRIVGGSTLPSTTNSTAVTWTTPGTYQLLVSASGPCGAASINDTLVVNVINSIQPDSVHNMLPANNAVNQQLPLTLSWVPANPSGFYTFDLYLWRADLPQPATPYAAGLTSVNYTVPISSGLLSNQAYKWMIVAHNGSCTQINTGPIQQFTLIPLPDLQVLNVQAPATAFSGQTIAINWTVKNNGPGNTTTSQSWTDAVFFSFDTIPNFIAPPNTNPNLWNYVNLPIRPLLVGTRSNLSALDSGQQYSNSINFTLPLNYSQPLYIYVITNYPAGANAPQQGTVLNDTARAPLPIIVTLSPTPDLRVDTVFTPFTTFSGSTINLTYKVKNYGVLTPSGASWTDKVYISQSQIFNINTATALKIPKSNGTYYANAQDARYFISSQMQADSGYTRSIPVVIPNFIFGTYFIYVFTNQTGSLYEGASSNNNTNSGQIQLFLTPTPKLTVSSLTLPVTTASTTQPIGINWNIKNEGFTDNIERNQGHYFTRPIGFCSCSVPPGSPPGTVCIPPKSYFDSTVQGSSYWLERVYLSTDSIGLNIGNATLLKEVKHGPQQYPGLLFPENITSCYNFGTAVNVGTAINPGSDFPTSANFNVPSNLQPGNYYIYVYTNPTQTVYEYPGTPQIRRSNLPIAIQRPDAVVSTVSVPANTVGVQTFAINYSVLNNGPGAVFNHVRKDRIYVSTSAVFDGNAQLISTQTYTENLPVDAPVQHAFSYSFPPSTSGNRYFYVHTNYDSSFRETNQNNNISSGALTNVTPAIANDLVVSSIQLADTVFTIFPTKFKYTVSNNGAGTTTGTWTDSIFISCSPTYNPALVYYIGKRSHSEVITGGGSYSDSFQINLPFNFYINSCFPTVANTTAYYYIKTNADNVVYEGSDGNNNMNGTGSRVTINPLVDHIVIQVTGQDTATVGRPYAASWTVKNIGYNPGYPQYYYWYDAVFFSPDSVFNANAVLATNFVENTLLNTNQTYSISKDITPPNIPAGNYYVFAYTNRFNHIAGEKEFGNNTNLIRDGLGAAKQIYVLKPLLADLTDSILSAPLQVATGQPLTIVRRGTNNGSGVTYPATWSDNVWLSSDFIPGNPGDKLLSYKSHSGNLQPGQFYNDTVTATIGLNVIPGNYVLISRINSTNTVIESNGNNNLAFSYITVYQPAPSDLIVEDIVKPDTVFLGYPIDTVKWVIKNNSANSAMGVSSDGIYLSQTSVLDSTAVLLGIKNKTINMGPLAKDTMSLTPLVNNITEGNYNLIVRTDLLNNIYESDKTNNTGISTSPIYVGVKELLLNVLTPNTLFKTDRFYKLIIPDSLSGATILVTLKSADSLSMVNQMFIGKGYVPSAAQFDYVYNTPNYGNQDIVMTSATAGVYYISIRCVSANPVNQNITLKAVKLPFSILTVQSNSGGNIGNVTIKISGSLFTNNMTATLTRLGTILTASSVYYTNSTIVYATFNLQGKPLGIYDVALIKPDTSIAVLANGFSVVPANNGGLNNGGGTNTGSGNGNAPGCDPGAAGGINSQLVTELVIPDKVLGGWPFAIQINYSNPTNVDIPAQSRVLYSERNILMAFTKEGLPNGTTALSLELAGNEGPPGIIRAGGSGTIVIYGFPPVTIPGHTIVYFKLR